MFVYGMLFWLLHRAMRLTFHSHDNSYSQPIFWLLPAVICLFYAMTDEVHQTFVPGRFGTFRDIGYDLLGTFLAFLKRYRYI